MSSYAECAKIYPLEKMHEIPMPNAPKVLLPTGKLAVPQHYLHFQQTLLSVSEIITHVDYSPKMPIFVGEDNSGIYIQVGIIGYENYDRTTANRPEKIVYGRKWRIDANTPTSEVIQAAFLAIQKAKEHEVRELFTYRTGSKVSAPFSSHQDLPMMEENREFFKREQDASNDLLSQITNVATGIEFEDRSVSIKRFSKYRSKILIDVELSQRAKLRRHEDVCSDFDHYECTLILDDLNPISFMHKLIDELVNHSNTMVAEHFTFKGFARFSKKIDPRKIAEFSTTSRPYERDMRSEKFATNFKAINYETDASKTPSIGVGALARKNRRLLTEVSNLTGHLPEGY